MAMKFPQIFQSFEGNWDLYFPAFLVLPCVRIGVGGGFLDEIFSSCFLYEMGVIHEIKKETATCL